MSYKRFAMREVSWKPSHTRKTGIPELLCISGFAVPEQTDGRLRQQLELREGFRRQSVGQKSRLKVIQESLSELCRPPEARPILVD